MNIPYNFYFVKWIKTDEIALVTDEQGQKMVLQESPKVAILSKFSETVKEYTRVLRGIMPEIFSIDNFIYHNFVQGQESGNSTTAFGITETGFNKINTKTLVTALVELQNLSTAGFLTAQNLEVRKSNWYYELSNNFKDSILTEYDQYYFESIRGFLYKYGRVIDEGSRYLACGKLVPENISVNCLLKGEGKDFVVSEWDELHLNNAGFDLASLYIWSWRNPAWRESLISEFKPFWSDDEGKLAIYIKYCQVFLSCQMIDHVRKVREGGLDAEDDKNAEGLLQSSKSLLKSILG